MGGQGCLPIAGGKAPGNVRTPWLPGAQIHKCGTGRRNQVQPSFSPGAARTRGLGAGYPAGVVDPVSLGPADELYKSFSTIAGERKYFSGASGIKISDKEHPAPRLRDVVIGAVTHSPFQTIPQPIQRGEDGVKRPALVMRKQSGYVLKAQIRRPSCFSQPGNLKEQGPPGVPEAPSLSAEAERLARKTGAEQIKVRHSSGVNFCGVWIKNLLLQDGMDGAVAGIGVLVDLAVADALEAPGPV